MGEPRTAAISSASRPRRRVGLSWAAEVGSAMTQAVSELASQYSSRPSKSSSPSRVSLMGRQPGNSGGASTGAAARDGSSRPRGLAMPACGANGSISAIVVLLFVLPDSRRVSGSAAAP